MEGVVLLAAQGVGEENGDGRAMCKLLVAAMEVKDAARQPLQRLEQQAAPKAQRSPECRLFLHLHSNRESFI